MKGSLPNAMRRFTRVGWPIGRWRAGKAGSATSIVRHVGRVSGRVYETPVVAVKHHDEFFVALPYGRRTDWLRNVLASGGAGLVLDGRTYQLERPEIVPMKDATVYFAPKQQRLHRRFGLESALKMHNVSLSIFPTGEEPSLERQP